MEGGVSASASQEDTATDLSSSASNSWNSYQEELLKGISERSNCMRWLHNQCQLHFESLNFWLTIPNVIISTLNGSFTMSLNSLFPDPGSQMAATTVIGLVSIFSAVLITMNQYVKSQQMMEANRSAALAYGKLYRVIMNELALRRDQRQNALEFLKLVRTEQDRLENSSPSILPKIIQKFNVQFADRDIEKPEIAGDLDEVNINQTRRRRGGDAPESGYYSPMRKLKVAGRDLVKPLLDLTSARGYEKPTRVVPMPQLPPIATPRIKTDASTPENVIVETPPPPP
jgi:hypothetical protein